MNRKFKGDKANMQTKGAILRTLRHSRALTQKEIADYLGLTPKMISFYENDERTPPADILIKLADYFNVSIDYLLGRTTTNPTENNYGQKILPSFITREDLILLDKIKKLPAKERKMLDIMTNETNSTYNKGK